MAKLWIISDIHLEMTREAKTRLTVPPCDALVIAGDYHRAALAVTYAREQAEDKPLIMISGNHEHYKTGLTVAQNLTELRLNADKDRSSGHQTYFLEDEVVEIYLAGETVKFVGSTLWTDFRLSGDSDVNMAYAKRAMNDFVYIRGGEDTGYELSPEETVSWYQASRAFIRAQLQSTTSAKTVVITHHLPSMRSVATKYRNDPLNPAFASNCDDLLELGADLWIHGHTHTSSEYREGRTRVICNPRGYPTGYKQSENRRFDPALVVEI